MTGGWKPDGYPSVSPYLITENAQEVIDFLMGTFEGGTERRFDNEDGTIMHAEVRIDDSVVMLGQAGDGWPAVPCHVHVYVPDVDATYARALRSGGTSVQEPVRKDDADKRGGVLDPGGNTWWLGTQQET